jgi:hypothetical protein
VTAIGHFRKLAGWRWMRAKRLAKRGSLCFLADATNQLKGAVT